MDVLNEVLDEIASGVMSFQPDGNSPEALERFEQKAQAVLAAQRRGLIGKALPHYASHRGRKTIDQVLIQEGLTYDGREFIGNATKGSESGTRNLMTATEMRDHSPEEIRSAIFDILADRESVRLEPKQFPHLEEGIKEVFSRREGMHDGNPSTRNFAILSENDKNTFFEVCEELKREGIIVEGLNAQNPGRPFFRLTNEGTKAVKNPNAFQPQRPIDDPAELQESLARFREDYPDSAKVAFIMMRFGRTLAHQTITTTIKKVLKDHGISAVRADDKDYHADLFPNIKTYMHGCAFGIAVLERLESEEFNPNVSLEIGYLLALGKPVLLLKDQTLKNLHTDLVGRLYRSFDPQEIESSIERELNRWLRDWKFISS